MVTAFKDMYLPDKSPSAWDERCDQLPTRCGGMFTLTRTSMKIVMLCDLYDETSQYQENLLAKYYVKNGHEVIVIAATFNNAADYYANRYERNAPARQYLDGRVRIIKLPYSVNILSRLRKFGGVADILARERPDLIFLHDIHLNLAEAAAYKRAHPSCRIIMDYHADYSNSGSNWLSRNILHKMIRKRILHRHKQYIDKIFPVVPVSAVFLNEVYGIAHEEMELLPLGADTDLAKSVRLAKAGTAVRSALEIPAEALVVFTGGRLTPLKKTHVLVEAFLQLADPSLHLIIVGDAERGQAEYKRRLLEKCAGHPRVHFVGWIDGRDVYRYMDACDFAVFPASQSTLWQQALSMGLPLIVGEGTHLGGQDPSYMNLYDNMIIVAQRDIRSDVIATHIREFSQNPALLKQRRASALRTSDELLNYDVIIAKTLSP